MQVGVFLRKKAEVDSRQTVPYNEIVPDAGKKPYVIAVANEKGGVAKTTSTLAIGTILAEKGFKVLCVDLDPQGNLTLSLGYKPQELPAANDPLTTEIKNLDLIFARPLIVDEAYQLRVDTGQDLAALVALPYDYVLMDCPPSLGKLALDALLVANFLVIPTQADFFSAYSLKSMMELVGLVRRRGNPDLPYRILVTLFDQRNSIHHSIMSQLNQAFGAGIFKTIIEVDAELRKAAILGFPTSSSRGEKQYRALVEEMLEYIQDLMTV